MLELCFVLAAMAGMGTHLWTSNTITSISAAACAASEVYAWSALHWISEGWTLVGNSRPRSATCNQYETGKCQKRRLAGV